ncbi:MAG: PorV/PorQ family protein [bacterium]|nr:PorV/PorQ family protein [bacterium]MCP4798910.1 PorV/PorQ family protein [bacterium]
MVKRILLLILITLPLNAGDMIGMYGDENIGTSGAQFLKIPVGARSIGMGKAFTAVSTDGSTPFWNPAGLMRTPGRKNIFISHSEYAAGIDLDYASYHWRKQNFAFAISSSVLQSGDILRTTEFHQEGTGDYFKANHYALGFSVAKAMTDRFSFGSTFKLYQENLDEYEVRSVLMDLGVLYFVGLGDLRVGFTVHNFGPDLKPNGSPPDIGHGYTTPGDFQSFSAPTSGSFGAAYTWMFSDEVGFLTAADFSHPADSAESFRFGGELALGRSLQLRSGYETNKVEGGLSAGFGVGFQRGNLDLQLDYAISDMGAFGTIHTLSMDIVPLLDRRRSRR